MLGLVGVELGGSSSSSFIVSSLELSETKVCEPKIRGLGTASHSCAVVVLKSRWGGGVSLDGCARPDHTLP